MKICEICGAEEQVDVLAETEETEMVILGVCENCRNDFIQNQS